MKNSQVLSLLLCYNFEKEFKNFSDKFTIKIDEKEYPNKVFWFIDDKCFMEYNQKTTYLWCTYHNFWEYFETKFKFNYEQVKYLIKYTIEKHFKLSEIIPENFKGFQVLLVEEHFNNLK